MNIVDTYKKCVGCGACVDVCPTNALELHHNENGFYVPGLQNGACVNCGKCINSCPALNTASTSRSPSVYYGWSTDEIIRLSSSSGGAFTVLAEQILAEGGVVFGAMYAADHKSIIMASSTECDLESLRRSKYCQSFPNNMYSKAAEHLKVGRTVMIVGTPCQISAARRLFGEHENLLLVDFICGGVTPEPFFSNYISYLEKKYKSKIKHINMRDKKRGWSKPRVRAEFENGKVYSRRYQFDYYYNYYCTAFMKNTPCITCAFVKHADADITIADFWGYKTAKVSNDEKGISLLCTYTAKGQKYLEQAKEKMVLHPVDAVNVEYAFREKVHSKETLLERERFLDMAKKSSFVEAAKKHRFKYGKVGVLLKIIIRKVVRK